MSGYLRDVFAPGLTNAEVGEVQQKLGISLPKEAIELYQWHNGVLVPAGTLLFKCCFLPTIRYFLSIEEATRDRELALASSENNPYLQWPPEWLPIFGSGSGDHLAIDCSRSNGERAPIVDTQAEQERYQDAYVSLTSLMQTTSECFATGAYYIDDRGDMECNDIKERIIGRKLNPGLANWTDEIDYA